jgi:hypothetical protein
MKFIEILLNNSTVKEAKLYTAAKKASINPESGVTILNKSAFHVIKDSATLAVRYLPHFIFGQYEDPFKALKGKFTKNDIVEFVNSTNSDFSNRQLLVLILSKIDKSDKDDVVVSSNVSYDVMASDPYGDYGSNVDVTPIETSGKDNIQILCEAFGISI